MQGPIETANGTDDEAGGEPAVPSIERPVPAPASRLRLLLVGLDATGLMLAWVIALGFVNPRVGPPLLPSMGLAAGITVLGLVIMNALELYLARTSTIRAVEFSRVVKASLFTGGAALIGLRVARFEFRVTEIAAGALLTFLFLLVLRTGYRAWIGVRRRDGHHVRRVVVVGAGADAAELIKILDEHADTGFRVVGVLGRKADALENGLIGLWCGTADQTCTAVDELGATGAVVAVGSVEPGMADLITRDLLRMGAHVHLSTGVRGIDSRRLRALPLAYEPLLYLEPVSLSKAQIAAKRVVDVTVSGMLLLVLSPVLFTLAALVKRHDGGSAFFAQERVGQGGRLFRVLKFRTMVPNAEAVKAELEKDNERKGPLFKMEDDPRVTPIGRFLRDSSLDELPQLINVLRGEMSLVGPRPALPSEVATFDDRLLGRNRVRPGITGLWQVEARDNPSFAAYRRLDLYYVDNWSPFLDVMIALGTVEQVITRMLRLVVRRRRPPDVQAPAAEAA